MVGKIGQWMIVEGLLNSKEVEVIVDKQVQGDKRLFGEIAIAQTYITPFDLKRFLRIKEDNSEKK